MAFSVENKNDRHGKILEFLRYGVFSIFYILSVRLVFASLYHAPIRISILVGMVALAMAILSWWKVVWCLYGFIIGIPLVSGLQIIGFMQAVPLLSFGFASIYLVWLPKRLLWDKKNIVPRTGIGSLIDILSAMVLLSLIMVFWPYPLDFTLHRFWFISFFGQNDQFWGIEASYILLQGLFFYRLMEMEISDTKIWKKIIPIVYIQVSIIILFSLLQWIYDIPSPPKSGKVVFSPFDDPHSYGSYVVLLFFVFLGLSFKNGRRHQLGILLIALLFCLIFLSASVATLAAMVIAGLAFLFTKIRLIEFIVIVCLILSSLLCLNLYPFVLEKSGHPVIKRYAQRLIIKNAPRPLSGRFMSWDQALGIVREFPITGSGIGTFYRISRHYYFSDKAHPKRIENAHNYYLQFAADLGIPALLLFLSIIFYTYKAGFRAFSKYQEGKNLVIGLLFGLSAYLITCLTGHPLLLSNQQFLFWFIIAAITIPHHLSGGGAVFNRFARHSKVLIGMLAALIVVGYVYKLYGTDTGAQRYEYGVYAYENWKGEKTRWTMKKAGVRVEAKGSLLAFDIFANPHNIGPQGLNLKVFVNGKLRDEVNFLVSGWKHLNYYLPSKKNEIVEVKTVVNKTFNPYRLGLSKDKRELGVAVREIKFLDEIPKDGVGFYKWETWGGGRIPGWPQYIPPKFRWTGMRASMNIKPHLEIEEFRDSGIDPGEIKATTFHRAGPSEIKTEGAPVEFPRGSPIPRGKHFTPVEHPEGTRLNGASPGEGIEVFLMCAHPGIGKDPVRVEIIGDDGIIREEVFKDNRWRKIIIKADELRGSKVLTFQVSRTWNPKLAGISEDSRDLGVAVAVLVGKLLVNRY